MLLIIIIYLFRPTTAEETDESGQVLGIDAALPQIHIIPTTPTPHPQQQQMPPSPKRVHFLEEPNEA